MRILFLLLSLVISFSAQGQRENHPIIAATEFPKNKWDKENDLSLVLAWTYKKYDSGVKVKLCINLLNYTDSTGNSRYYISQMFTNQKPYDTWFHSWIHYGPDYNAGSDFGYRDVHLKDFKHILCEEELYDLLSKWKFSLIGKNAETIEAGVDQSLMQSFFGFKLDLNRLIEKD